MYQYKTVTIRFEKLYIINDGDRFGSGEIYVRFSIDDGETYFEGRIPEQGVWRLNDGDTRNMEGPTITFEETVRDVTVIVEVFDRDMMEDQALGEEVARLVHRFADRYRPGTHVHKTRDYELTYTVEVR